MKNRIDARGTRRLSSGRLLLVTLFALALLPAAAARAQGGREPRRLFLVEDERGRDAYIDRTGKVVLSLAEGLDFTEYVRGGQLFWPGRLNEYEDERAGLGVERDGAGRRYRTRVSPGEFSDGLARFSFDTRPGARSLNVAYGFIDETGKVVIPPIYRHVQDFRDGRAMFDGEGGKRGYIDREGKVVIPPTYALTWGFSEGLAAACLKNDIKDNQCGYIDREGRAVHPFKLYAATHFSEGLALIGIDGVKMAYIDKTMRVVFNMKEGEYGGEFHEGLATIRVGVRGKYGYMNRTGRVVIPAEYDDARDFSEGLALVAKDEQYGFIDRTGKVVIPLRYAYGSSFSEGLAAVTVSRDWQVPGWGYIDREGRTRVEMNLDYAARFSGGLGAIDRVTDRQNIPDAYIDAQGRFVWEKPRRY